MTSPLNERIRSLAREEAAALIGVGTPAPGSADADRVTALETEVVDLRARLDALEKGAGQTNLEARPAVRRTRKAAESE